MKNILFFFFCIFLALSFSTCEKPPVEIESTITPASLHFNAAGGQGEFKVTVQFPATVESVEALDTWCRVSKNGVSPVNVVVAVDPNIGEARNTSVVVHLKSGNHSIATTVQISQERAEIEYIISPASLNFNAAGGDDGFKVSIKSPATIESVEALDAWCQVSTSGEFPVDVTVTVDPNTNSARNTSIVVNMKVGEKSTSATVQISQDGAWVLIKDIKWATRNVDAPGTFAAHPEDAGMYYQWNRKVGWSTTDPMINSDGGTTWDNSNPEGDSWEKANDPCPPGWRVPTHTELESLRSAGSQWTIVNGVGGCTFGSGNASLFLPVAGYRYAGNGMLINVGIVGFCWGSTVTGNSAYYMGFSSMDASINYDHYRNWGNSVRCVAE